jgi:methylenetetrahydrofolate dehydrogenase (NADP+)/methenyltetrahydrofolate cyclohydrolase
MNKIIDGKKIADAILEELKEKTTNKQIGLAVLIVGENEASKIYVKMKKNACEKVGIKSFIFEFLESISEDELICEIDKLNKNTNVHGILVQMPLPKHIDPQNVIYAIDPKKDVDGFHPLNIGKMFLGQKNVLMPCTPLGVKILLEKANVEVEGKHVVIIGRSNIVGKPLAAILVQNQKGCNATVTIAHRKTENLKEITKSADILISAVGKPNLVTKDMVKKGVVVIDVGITRLKEKKKIVGDVDFENVLKVASKITPVPGGVGPMTIAILLENTYKSFLNHE